VPPAPHAARGVFPLPRLTRWPLCRLQAVKGITPLVHRLRRPVTAAALGPRNRHGVAATMAGGLWGEEMRRTIYRPATLRHSLSRILAEGLDPACAPHPPRSAGCDAVSGRGGGTST